MLVANFNFASAQENFAIKNYDVNINLLTDGSFVVTEKIKVNFLNQQRGIIRKIPYRFTNSQNTNEKTLKQINHPASYEILISDITVKDFEMTTNKDGDDIVIKIGTPDKYLEGEHTYEITYSVYGAINQYADYSEFAWNLIGHQWNVEIENASYVINFPKAAKLEQKSLDLKTGYINSEESNVTKDIAANTIKGKITKALAKNQGLTIFVKLAADYFTATDIPISQITDSTYIANNQIEMVINKNSSIEVTETRIYKQTKSTNFFTKSFPLPNYYAEQTNNYFIEKAEVFIYQNDSLVPCKLEVINQQKNKSITAITDNYLTGDIKVVFKYKIWGAFVFNSDITFVNWDVIEKEQNIHIQRTEFTVFIDKNIFFDPASLNLLKSGYATDQVIYEVKDNMITGYQNYQEPKYQQFVINISFFKNQLNLSEIPIEVLARDFYIKNFTTIITIEKDGLMTVKHSFEVQFLRNAVNNDGYFSFTTAIQKKYKTNFHPSSQELTLEYPQWRLFGKFFSPILQDIKSEQPNFEQESSWDRYVWYTEDMENEQLKYFSYEYKVYNLLKEEGDFYILNFPVIPNFNEPIQKGNFKLILPDNADEGFAEFKGYIINKDKNETPFVLLANENIITADFKTLENNSLPIIKIKFSEDYITDTAFLKKIRLILKNNRPLFFFILVIIILYLLWRKYTKRIYNILEIEEKYFPPTAITAADAGFIWDNKLHKKDLNSLLLQWAAAGYMDIVEIEGGADYKLVKRTHIPKTATNYERTFYDALFSKDTKEVDISALKHKFKHHIKQVESDFVLHANYRNFYLPGTKAFTNLILGIGSAFCVIGGFAFLVNAFYGDYQTGIFFILAGIATIFASKKMPKFAGLGEEKYKELLGFKKFIENATLTKLEELVEQNPDYYVQTLPFAIVMGLHKEWAEKFEALIMQAPQWYKYGGDNTFTSSLFLAKMLNFMNLANLAFHLKTQSNYSNTNRYYYSNTNNNTTSRSSNSGKQKNYSSNSKRGDGNNNSNNNSNNKSKGGGGGNSSNNNKSGDGKGGGGGDSW